LSSKGETTVTRDRIVTVVLIGFGILGLLYYLAKKPAAASPGSALAAPGSAGGASLARAATSASGGVQGSIPTLIAAAAALTGTNYGKPAGTLLKNASPAPQPSTYDPANVLIQQGFAGTQMVSTDQLTDPNFPDLASRGFLPSTGPDLASQVTALDAGGLDLGTLYTSSASYAGAGGPAPLSYA
jgi:hypothetical protein